MSGKRTRTLSAAGLAVLLAVTSAGHAAAFNLAENDDTEGRIVKLFTPMAKTPRNVESTALSSSELTMRMAEDALGLTLEFDTYTAEDYRQKTYDEVLLERARAGMDDIYLMNPDGLAQLGAEGLLADLSGLESAANLKEIVRIANTVDGKLVGIPQEVVAYGLFCNRDLFEKYGLSLPGTPDELLHCCEVFQENGIEFPIGANRWWLECFVFALAYDDLYMGDHTEEEIAALNQNEAKYSDYMRPGFEYLKTMFDAGYIDAKTALTYEAIEGEGEAFCNGETPIVMAYWGAATNPNAYGTVDFDMQVIGFPSDYGPVSIISLSGYGVIENAEHREDALAVLDVMLSDEALTAYETKNPVISPSKNVSFECPGALEPLYEAIENGQYVLTSNAAMKLEQWGNVCNIVRELMAGASVEECMAMFDELQAAQE